MDDSIDDSLRELLQAQGSVSSRELAARTGITRQALHSHFQRWLAEGRLARHGRGRATRYSAPLRAGIERRYPIAGLAEEQVWLEVERWLDERDARRSDAADRVLHYVLTEMVNNAIDHSSAEQVVVGAEIVGTRCRVEIQDAGVGALENVRSRLALDDHLHALQQLSKGKTTTDPRRHSGEGLFFSSKMVDEFTLEANGLAWVVDRRRNDQTVVEARKLPGTRIRFEVDLQTELAPVTVFEQYTNDFEFDTTRCVVSLFELGVHFVSRSEAKRLVQGLERFKHVVLDFAGVEGVGQGFVDEVLRVWAAEHPEVRIEPVNMAPTVEFMVRRGLRGANGDGAGR